LFDRKKLWKQMSFVVILQSISQAVGYGFGSVSLSIAGLPDSSHAPAETVLATWH
jgi:hypothetical protein